MVGQEASQLTVSGTLAGIITCQVNMVTWLSTLMSVVLATTETLVESQYTGDWVTLRQKTFFMLSGENPTAIKYSEIKLNIS